MFFKRRPVFLSEGCVLRRRALPRAGRVSASVLAGNDPATAPLAPAEPGQMVTIPPLDGGREGEEGREDGSGVERDEVEGEVGGPGFPARLFERERPGVGRLQGGM